MVFDYPDRVGELPRERADRRQPDRETEQYHAKPGDGHPGEARIHFPVTKERQGNADAVPEEDSPVENDQTAPVPVGRFRVLLSLPYRGYPLVGAPDEKERRVDAH